MVGGRGVYPPRCGAKRNGGNIRAGARERRGGKGNIHPNSGHAGGRGSGQRMMMLPVSRGSAGDKPIYY